MGIIFFCIMLIKSNNLFGSQSPLLTTEKLSFFKLKDVKTIYVCVQLCVFACVWSQKHGSMRGAPWYLPLKLQ